MGTVWLTKPFEAVVVNTAIAQPKSSILNLSLDQINNMLIVTPPKEVREEKTRHTTKGFNFLDENALDKDMLKFDGLDKNALDKPTGLERNYLDSDFLLNYLDIQNSQMLSNELDEYNGLLPKYSKATGLKYSVDDTTLTLYRETYSSYFELRVDTSKSLTLNINQDNLAIKQVVNSAGTTTITINQSN
jgi:hypothetical protein